MLCHGLALLNRFEEARLRAEATLATVHPSRHHLADARLARGIACAWSNRLDDARRDLSAVLGASQERSLMQAVTARAHLADVHLRDGRLADASDVADEAIDLLEDSHAVWLTPLPHSVAAYALAEAGEFDRAELHARIASDSAAAIQNAPAMIWAEAAWLRLADARADDAQVVRTGDRMLAARLDAVAEGVNHWRASYAEALARVDRPDDAAAVLEALEHQLAQAGDHSIQCEIARARAVLAARQGDAEGAESAIDQGLALDPELSRPLPRARLELTAGSHLRRLGRRSTAAELLRSAEQRLRRIGATPWLERCTRELDACGLRPARRSGPASEASLTSHERRVAHLVSEGRTNRQVADELYVSIKTVESHLSRIYTKLGVRSRLQMAAALRAAQDG
ncbi:helix-turn-helix domain-containing protein [Microbacterium album]|uniref:HTH luxR-type domain-containing protein n=1 Tax=Microbacterium album TaxID=2053191 RepID=A0A917IFB5_9MICO|nr:helix-turn-helix transcriptional regulator [Microbacterium album]GGH44056.1 hypothetical protein GCM10010921_18450 [Microbacterium album]